MPMDRSKCEPVIPGGACPNCGWSLAAPWYKDTPEGNRVPQPHEYIAHPAKKLDMGKCANCGEPYTLDAVKCAACGFEPKSEEMWEKLRQEKNVYRRNQFLRPIDARPTPIATVRAVPRTNA